VRPDASLPVAIYVADARCDRDSNTSPDFQLADGQNPGAAWTGCNRCRRPKPSSPHNRFRIRQDRPLRTLPYRNTSLLEERLDLFRGGDPPGLVLVSRPPIPQFQRTGEPIPVDTTHPIIIYVLQGACC